MPDDDATRRAVLDLAKAEANLRQAVLGRRVEGVDDVATTQRALETARAAFEKTAHPRPRVAPSEPPAKSWGSH